MRHWHWFRGACAVVVWACLGLVSHAASIGVFFDAAGRQDNAEVAPFSSFVCYVAMRDLGGDLSGYEFRLLAPPQLTLLGASAIPASSLNIGSAPANWIVGVGVCLDPMEPRAVVQITGMLMAEAVNLELRLAASQPSSSSANLPVYALCEESEIHEFDDVTSAVLNLRPASFGSIKQRYGED